MCLHKYVVIIHSNNPSKLVVGEMSPGLFYDDPLLQAGAYITFHGKFQQYRIDEVQYDMVLNLKSYMIQDILTSNFGELAETMSLFEDVGFKFK